MPSKMYWGGLRWRRNSMRICFGIDGSPTAQIKLIRFFLKLSIGLTVSIQDFKEHEQETADVAQSVSKLETDAAQRPKKRRSIPPPPAQRRSQSFSDLTADTPPTPPIVPIRHQSTSDKKIMQDAVEKYVIGKKGRRSFDKQASLERASKLVEDSKRDEVFSSSSGSTSPDRNIRSRTEVLPNELKSPSATSAASSSTSSQFSPLNPRPYIRSNLATARLKPLKDRSASQPSLHNTVSQAHSPFFWSKSDFFSDLSFTEQNAWFLLSAECGEPIKARSHAESAANHCAQWRLWK